MFYRFVGTRRKSIDLDNTFRGSCFLVGGGYQLAQEKGKLSDRRIATMAMNNSATQFDPTLWVGADTADHYSDSILANQSIMKFMYVTKKDGTIVNRPLRSMGNMYFVVGLSAEYSECFARGRNFGWWKNVFVLALQLIYRLGFSRVYTVGCGLKIDSAKGAYGYKSDLTPEEIKYNERTYAMVLSQVSNILEFAQDAKFEIISCTPDSALNSLVPYRDFDEAYAEEIAKIPEPKTVGLKHPKRIVEAVSVPAQLTVDSSPRTKRVSILIPTFNRDDLLELGVQSIGRQKLSNSEVLVLNDGPDSPTTRKIAEDNGATYVHTGTRFNDANNQPKIPWRVPGYAFNVGAKIATGEILVLTCPEIWHMEPDTVERLVEPVSRSMTNVGIPDGKDDDGSFLKAIKSDKSHADFGLYEKLKNLRTELPFLMAVSKISYMSMGGYDEDFTGRCYDDDDFIERLKSGDHEFVKTSAHCVHLYHPRQTIAGTGDKDRVEFNRKLFNERRGNVVRNFGREWGKL
jgi:glycosyltransferase involved in cell wall biosynthesis